MKLIIQSHPNTEVLTVHSDLEVTNVRWAEIERSGVNNEYFRKANFTTRELLELLVSIPGVTEVKANGSYEVRLVKGLCFNWGDIEPQIIRTFKNVFGVSAKVERKHG